MLPDTALYVPANDANYHGSACSLDDLILAFLKPAVAYVEDFDVSPIMVFHDRTLHAECARLAVEAPDRFWSCATQGNSRDQLTYR